MKRKLSLYDIKDPNKLAAIQRIVNAKRTHVWDEGTLNAIEDGLLAMGVDSTNAIELDKEKMDALISRYNQGFIGQKSGDYMERTGLSDLVEDTTYGIVTARIGMGSAGSSPARSSQPPIAENPPAKPNPNGGIKTRNTDLDQAEWETKRVSGNVFKIDEYGNRKIRASDFKKFKKDMDQSGIKVVIDKEKVPKNKAGGFDPETGIMYFRGKPSQIAAFHESVHAKQWLELGKNKYLKQSILEREEHVYKIIMENKKNFTRAELIATERYIYKLRNNGRKAPFGWPPADSEIFRGCLDE
ncbi:zincin-like metallopeptidase toxin domain-containing protein [Paenibacillus polymyxa]|uniref:zincin-like metallopeptidase toxin domain-containing protein n=1 Tax=Paenibacillus polymyxa TaxID=1406 RepID=UPI002ED03F50|nr:zincin-like metallopeptidase toxin domain-containing protein [Paenibacillus polymyxa]